MKTAAETVVLCLLLAAVIWPFGCSRIPFTAPEEKPSPAPESRVVNPPPAERIEPAVPPSTPEITYFTHRVRWPGENLIRISRWYTGSGNNWLLIVDANPSIDPRRIKIGDSILIPESLLRTREPMPIDHLPTGVGEKKESPAPTPASSPPSKDVELFGPIGTETPSDRSIESGSTPPLETIE